MMAWVCTDVCGLLVCLWVQARIGIAVLIRHFLELQKGAASQQHGCVAPLGGS